MRGQSVTPGRRRVTSMAGPTVGGTVLVVDGRDRGRVELADTYLRRLRGMLGRRTLPDALLLLPGGSVHGWGMRDTLDVAFLGLEPAGDRRHGPFRVVRVGVLRPWRLLGSPRGVRAVLESPAGTFSGWGLVVGSLVSPDGRTAGRREGACQT